MTGAPVTPTPTPAAGAARRTPAAWLPEALLAVAVLAVGVAEAAELSYVGWSRLLPVVLATTAAVALCRHAPAAALLLVWLTGGYQLLGDVPVLLVQAAVAAVAFGCARWGRVPTVVLSGLSIPAAAALVLLASYLLGAGSLRAVAGAASRGLYDSASSISDSLVVGAVVLGFLVLAVPWTAGLAVRAVVRARRSEASEEVAQVEAARAQHEAAQAREIARLREEQAALARDVHDVVGHSLAVILAQAEAAQYLPDDPARLKQTLATVATSARTSLQDVRRVLAQPGADVPPSTAAFQLLVDGVRATGQVVDVAEVGTPRPLPPELETVAHRVVQEMLTNAVKHGRRDRPVRLERHWPQAAYEHDLRLEVTNSVPAGGPASTEPDEPLLVAAASDETQPLARYRPPPLPGPGTGVPTEGSGLAGMRRRVEAVGGRLDVRRRAGADLDGGDTFTATAWVPVRQASR